MEKTAVIFSGHCRNYSCSPGHQTLVHNSNMDIHIHTWTDQGIRSELGFLKTDPILLSNLYQPSTIRVDDIKNISSTSFNLSSNSDPIFLYNGQKFSDNPPRYLNQYLYSTYIAYSNMRNYEDSNGFHYGSIFQLPLDYKLESFDSSQFYHDIIYNGLSNQENLLCSHRDSNLLFFLGGCRLCNRDITISTHVGGHVNDLEATFAYGRRSLMVPVCELYLNAENIYRSFQQSNLIKKSQLLQDHNTISQINTISGITPFLSPLRTDRNFIYLYNHNPPISHDIVCYHPDRLLRESLSNIVCLDGKSIRGSRNDVLYQPFYKNE